MNNAMHSQAPRFYPADDVKKPLKRRNILRPTRLRPSITPGTVLILLAGRFKGRRCVFLRQLPSGLLLVTGPFRINGVRACCVHAASCSEHDDGWWAAVFAGISHVCPPHEQS